MEQKIYYVAVAFGTIFQPTIVEKFDNLTDAESYARYAALMCCAKKARYIVLEQQTEWNSTPQENT